MIDRMISVGPDGVAHPIPPPGERLAALRAVEQRAEAHRRQGRRVVVVQGLGFVGAAVAAAVADAADAHGQPRYFVIGIDLPGPGSYWKVAVLNDGRTPVTSPDAELARCTRKAVRENGNLCAVACDEAYGFADVIIMDVPLDVQNRVTDSPKDIRLGLENFLAAVRAVGRSMRPDALVLVETTVPVGACRRLVAETLREERERRGIRAPLLLAHAYERVMPGPNYLNSIRRYWRTVSANDPASRAAARDFLDSFVDTAAFPLAELPDTDSSELAKLLENSYRAVNIALIHEWTLLAERLGIDLFAVIDSIRVRHGTHDNMRYPGFGVGGYCLTKDAYLAQWAATHLWQTDVVLPMTLEAMAVNYHMPLHALNLLAELLGGDLAGRQVAVCGVSYLPDVADTRNSPAEQFVDQLLARGAAVRVHDPCAREWPQRPEVRLTRDLGECLRGADGVVLTVPHRAYRELSAAQWLGWLSPPAAVVDAHNVLGDEQAEALYAAGCRLLGVGKGHWRRREYQCPR